MIFAVHHGATVVLHIEKTGEAATLCGAKVNGEPRWSTFEADNFDEAYGSGEISRIVGAYRLRVPLCPVCDARRPPDT